MSIEIDPAYMVEKTLESGGKCRFLDYGVVCKIEVEPNETWVTVAKGSDIGVSFTCDGVGVVQAAREALEDLHKPVPLIHH